jgi:hypothetical protein
VVNLELIVPIYARGRRAPQADRLLNGRHRTAVLLGELEVIPLAIQFTEEALIPLEVLRKFTQRELSPGSILNIPDLPVLTQAQLGAVSKWSSAGGDQRAQKREVQDKYFEGEPGSGQGAGRIKNRDAVNNN